MSTYSFLKHSLNSVFSLVTSTSKIKLFTNWIFMYSFSNAISATGNVFLSPSHLFNYQSSFKVQVPLLENLIEFPRVSLISFLL